MLVDCPEPQIAAVYKYKTEKKTTKAIRGISWVQEKSFRS